MLIPMSKSVQVYLQSPTVFRFPPLTNHRQDSRRTDTHNKDMRHWDTFLLHSRSLLMDTLLPPTRNRFLLSMGLLHPSILILLFMEPHTLLHN